MSNSERIECLDRAKAAMKGIVAEVEGAIGVQAGLGITLPLLQAIDSADTAIKATEMIAADGLVSAREVLSGLTQ